MTVVDVILLAELRTGRTPVSVFCIDHYLYALGGFSAFAGDSTEVESYDTITYLPWLAAIFGFNQWSYVSTAPRRIGSASITAVNNLLHVIGGATPVDDPVSPGDADAIATPRTAIYDVRLNAWTQGRLNVPRQQIGVTAISDGRVFAVGGLADATGYFQVLIVNGYNDNAPTIVYPPGSIANATAKIHQSVPAVEIYQVGAWNMGPPLNTARHGCLVLADSRDRVYAIGGVQMRTGNYYLADPGSDAWVVSASDLLGVGIVSDTGTAYLGGIIGPGDYTPPNRGQFIYSDGQIHGVEPPSAGAYGTFNFASNEAERWSPTTNTWERLPTMFRPRPGTTTGITTLTGVIDEKDRVVVCSANLGKLNTWSSERFDPVTNEWEDFGDFPISQIEFVGIADPSVHQMVWIDLFNGYKNRRVFAGVTYSSTTVVSSFLGNYYLYELLDDGWHLVYEAPFEGCQLFFSCVMDNQQRPYFVGGSTWGALFNILTLLPTKWVRGFGSLGACIHGEATVEVVNVNTYGTEDMVLLSMPEQNVVITEAHFDPCHPQTESQPIRIDAQVNTRNRKV